MFFDWNLIRKISYITATFFFVQISTAPVADLLFAASEGPPAAQLSSKGPLSTLIQENKALEEEIEVLRQRVAKKKTEVRSSEREVKKVEKPTKPPIEPKKKVIQPEAKVQEKIKPTDATKSKQTFWQKVFGIKPKTPEEKAKEEELKRQKVLEKERKKKIEAEKRKKKLEEKKRKEELRKQARIKAKEDQEKAKKEKALLEARKKAEAKAKKKAEEDALTEAKKKLSQQKRTKQKEVLVSEPKSAKAKGLIERSAERLTNLTLGPVPFHETPLNIELIAKGPQPNMLNLPDAVERGIAVSIPKEIARTKKSLQTRKFVSAIRDLFPEFKFMYHWEFGSLTGGRYKDNTFSFDMKQPLFQGFSLVNSVLKVKHNRKAAIEEIQEAVNTAIYDTMLAYFELTRANLVYQNHVDLAEASQRYTEMSDRKKKEGLISEIENLNVQKIHAEVLSERETLWGEKETAALELKKVLRINPQTKINVAPLYGTDSENLKLIENFGREVKIEAGKLKFGDEATLDDFLILAYEHRPDLKVEENLLIANRYAEKAVKGKWLPTSELTLNMGQKRDFMYSGVNPDGSPRITPPFGRDFKLMIVNKWNLGGSTMEHNFTREQTAPSVTTFQGGQGTTKTYNSFSAALLDNLEQFEDVKQAELDTVEQLEAYDSAEREAVREVVEAFYGYRSAIIKLQAITKGLDYHERSVQLSKLKLDQNEIQLSEYMETLQDLTTQRDEYHNAMADYFFAKADLNHAVGLQDLVPIHELIDLKSKQGSES